MKRAPVQGRYAPATAGKTLKHRAFAATDTVLDLSVQAASPAAIGHRRVAA
jgi:hypothetical protein